MFRKLIQKFKYWNVNSRPDLFGGAPAPAFDIVNGFEEAVGASDKKTLR